MRHLLKFVVLGLFFNVSPTTSALAQSSAERMRMINFMIGQWDVQTHIYDDDGRKSEKIFRWSQDVNTEMDSTFLFARSVRLSKNGNVKPIQVTLYFWDLELKQFVDHNIDPAGYHELKVGDFKGKDLILAYPEYKLGPNGKMNIWRKIFTDVDSNSFRILWEYQHEGDQRWNLKWEETYTRK